MGLLLACLPAFALNPALDIDQYAHKTWAIREGFSKGVINAIAQTPDGYLWLGTEFGLLRFDGIQAVPWSPPGPQVLPGSFVRALFAARDGTLWIGTQTGLASWNGARLTRCPEFDGKDVLSILEDRGGELWVGVVGATGRLCSIRGRQTHCYGEDGSFGSGVFSLYEDATGNLWAGDSRGLWRFKPDPPKRYASSPTEIQSIVQGDDGKLLMAVMGGVRQLVSGKIEPYPPAAASAAAYRLLRDRDGGLWIATYGHGLIHVHQGRTDVFSRTDGLSSDAILSVFEDREGNIWAATTEGLDRFRELPVITISSKQGLSSDRAYSVLVARDGSVWLSGLNGLDRWKDGRVSTFRKADGLPDDLTTSLFEDDGGGLWVATRGGLARFEAGRFVTVDRALGSDAAITGDAEHLWVSQKRGLLHFISGRLAEEFPWPQLGSDGRAGALAVDRKRGGLWLGFYSGLAYLQDGQVRARYTRANGLGGEHVADVQLGRTDALWAATEGGLSVIRQGRIQTLSSKNGLPCDVVHWRTRGDDGSVWLYMSCGLVRI
ncbi:MAG TPA: two-component regulator propeller domain-containing protein, partial [Methylococcaceae bacterium]|nr:two-component regulator propeller domain-containing protein [Methylococcaceae bacterium]